MNPGQNPTDMVRAALLAEEQRRQALQTGDWLALDELLSEQLVYVHSTAASDTKKSLMAKLEGGELQYVEISFADLKGHAAGDCVVITGRLSAEVCKQGQSKQVRSLFMTVWTLNAGGSGRYQWQLIAHQGTSLPI
jgi:hypothetical protein